MIGEILGRVDIVAAPGEMDDHTAASFPAGEAEPVLRRKSTGVAVVGDQRCDSHCTCAPG